MSPNNDFDVGPLTWVKGEIDTSLEKASAALAQTPEDGERREPLRFAQSYVHQASGALSVVGLDGVSQFADAIDKLLSVLAAEDRPPSESVVQLVERGIAALSNYLNELIAGARHQPLRLFPLYAEIVVATGHDAPQPSELFFPDLSVRPPMAEAPPVDEARAAHELRILRSRFEKGLLAWIRKPMEAVGPLEMLKAVHRINQIQALPSTRAFWWSAIAFFEGLAQQSIMPDRQAQRLCRRIDTQMRRLIDGSQVVAERLVRDVLYFVATAGVDTEHARAVRAVYRLDAVLPAPNLELSETLRQPVSMRLRESLEQAKEMWNRFSAGAAAAFPQFDEKFSELVSRAELMRMPQVDRLLSTMSEVVRWLREDPLRQSDALAMEVATGLLVTEQTTDLSIVADPQLLRQQVDVLCERYMDRVKGKKLPPLDDSIFGEASQRAQERLFFNQLAREILTNLGQIEQALDAFFRNPDAQRESVAALVKPLKQIEGAFVVQGQADAAQLVRDSAQAIAAFAAGEGAPAAEDCDGVAHKLSALGFYVEALKSGPARLDYFLDPKAAKAADEAVAAASGTLEAQIARGSRSTQELVKALKDAPEDRQLREQLVSNFESMREDAQLLDNSKLEQQARQAIASLKSADSNADVSAVLSAVSPSLDTQPSEEASRLMSVSREELDAELLEIFLEEAGEVLETQRDMRQKLAAGGDSQDALVTIRRSFHTLKGSSRMVGLQAFSDVAYHVEHLMNRWLQLEKSPDAQILGLIDQAQEVFVAWVDQLNAGGALDFEASALVARAEQMLAALDATPEAQILAEQEQILPGKDDAPADGLVESAQPGANSEESLDLDLSADEGAAPQPLPMDDVLSADESGLLRDDSEDAAYEASVTATQLALPAQQDAVRFDADPGEGEHAEFDLAGSLTFGELDRLSKGEEPMELDLAATSFDMLDGRLDDLGYEPMPGPETPNTADDADLMTLDLDFALEAEETAEADAAPTVPAQEVPAVVADESVARWQPEPSSEDVELDLSATSFDMLDGPLDAVNFQALSDVPADNFGEEGVELDLPLEALEAELPDEVSPDFARRTEADEATAEEAAAGTSDGAPQFEPSEPASSVALDTEPEPEPEPEPEAVADDELLLADAAALAGLEQAEVLAEQDRLDAADEEAARPETLGEDEPAEIAPAPAEPVQPSRAAEDSRPADSSDEALEVVAIDDSDSEEEFTLPQITFTAVNAGTADHEKPVTSSISDVEVIIGEQRLSRGLYDLFMGEARQHLATLAHEVMALENDPASIPSEQVVRAAHTLSGIAGTARIEPTQNLAKTLEHALHRFAELYRPFDDTQLATVSRAVTQLDGMLALLAVQQMPAAEDELIEALDQLRPAMGELPEGVQVAPPAEQEDDGFLPAPAVADEEEEEAGIQDELDEQLLPIFFEEADEVMQEMGNALRNLREQPDSAAEQQAVARHLHTLKGSARMVGAMRMGEFVHDLETRFLQMPADAQRVDLMEHAMDHASLMLNALRDPAAAATLAAMASGPVEEGVLSSAVADQAEPAVSGEQPAAAPQIKKDAAAVLRLFEDDVIEEQVAAPSSKALVRVRADLVDRFINEAGEISIARTRVEGEMRTLRRSLLDLTENVIRLRNQLREVEIQAESQMQSRIAAAEARHLDFDPLEVDRFTRLQEVTRMMAESVGDVTTIQQNLLRNLDSSDAALHAQARLSRDLQQALMGVRMVPFNDVADRLHRVVRQAAKDLGKRVNLDIRGGNIEIDRGVLDKMVAPIEHLLRNAVAHGIEPPSDRASAGKSEFGQITLDLRQLSNEIAIEMSDDGRGLNFERILARGREAGLVGADEEPGENRLTQLIFEPGFSTAESVSGVAGRGVGMDVVKNETLSVGGRIDVSSTAGQGARFLVHLPLTLAVTQALLVQAVGRTYAIPSTMVEQAMEVKEPALDAMREAGYVEWKDTRYPFRYLPPLLGHFDERPTPGRYHWVLLLRAGNQTVALHIDSLRGNQEVIVKNAGPQFVRLQGFTGATVLPDGEIALILNPVVLAGRVTDERVVGSSMQRGLEAEPTEAYVPTVMVVDDSLTVRKITSRLLEREGFHVVTAKDGVDALEKLGDMLPDVMLSDIEMPRMDGFDLARNVRADERLRELPIIMITSRMAEKHRNYAAEIGVNHYLGKPFQEDHLLELIRSFVQNKF